MKRINLEKIMAYKGMSAEDMGVLLFPENSFPKLALNRVLAGTSSLNELQIGRLSAHTGLSVGQLFGEDWEVDIYDDPFNGSESCYSLVNGDYVAEINITKKELVLMDKGKMFYERYILDTLIPLEKLINEIDLIIKKREIDEFNEN